MKKGSFFTSTLQAGLHVFNFVFLGAMFLLWGSVKEWTQATPFPGSGPFFLLVVWFGQFLQPIRCEFAYPTSRRGWYWSRCQVIALVLAGALGFFLLGRLLFGSGTVPLTEHLTGPLWAFFLFFCYSTGPYLWCLTVFRQDTWFGKGTVPNLVLVLGALFLPWLKLAAFLSSTSWQVALAGGLGALGVSILFGALAFRHLRKGS